MAGGNAFMMYSSTIFKNNHASEATALIGTILIGAMTVDGVYSYSLITDGMFFSQNWDKRSWKEKSNDLWNNSIIKRFISPWNFRFL